MVNLLPDYLADFNSDTESFNFSFGEVVQQEIAVHVMYALLSSSLDCDSKIKQGKGVGERAKRARHSQVCSIENRDIYIYICRFFPFDP